jgi:acyl-coenzyme A thioesterase PaaI-like protein
MEAQVLQNHIRPFGETCFGCGQANAHGLRIQSRWEGAEGVCRWTAQPWHEGAPGILSGGILATLLDCHMAVTATAHAYRAAGRALGSEPRLVYVTASLQVDYLKPTPVAGELELRARVTADGGRKIRMACSVRAAGQETARGEALFVRVEGHTGSTDDA